jgi:hypothetical protein
MDKFKANRINLIKVKRDSFTKETVAPSKVQRFEDEFSSGPERQNDRVMAVKDAFSFSLSQHALYSSSLLSSYSIVKLKQAKIALKSSHV